MTEIIRRTWAEIDLDALANNYRRVREAADPKARVCCVVKADGYGHGALRMSAQELRLEVERANGEIRDILERQALLPKGSGNMREAFRKAIEDKH